MARTSKKTSSSEDNSQDSYPTLNELADHFHHLDQQKKLEFEQKMDYNHTLMKMVAIVAHDSKQLLEVSPFGPVAKVLLIAVTHSKYLMGKKEALWAACYYFLVKAIAENRKDMNLIAGRFLILMQERETALYVITKALTEKGKASELLQSKIEIRDPDFIVTRMILADYYDNESVLKELGFALFDEKIDFLRPGIRPDLEPFLFQELGKGADSNELLMEYLEEKIRANDLNSINIPWGETNNDKS